MYIHNVYTQFSDGEYGNTVSFVNVFEAIDYQLRLQRILPVNCVVSREKSYLYGFSYTKLNDFYPAVDKSY
jgi:hypothetical protein